MQSLQFNLGKFSPCKFYSCLLECFKTKKVHGPSYQRRDVSLKKTLEIIEHFKPKQWFAENPHLEYFEKGISCNVYNMLMWTILNLDPCIKSQQGYGTDQTKSKIKMCAIRVQGSDMTSEKTGRLIHQNHQTKGGVRRVSGRLLYKIPE